MLEPAFHWARSDESVGFTKAVVCSNCDHLKFYRSRAAASKANPWKLIAELDPDRDGVRASHLSALHPRPQQDRLSSSAFPGAICASTASSRASRSSRSRSPARRQSQIHAAAGRSHPDRRRRRHHARRSSRDRSSSAPFAPMPTIPSHLHAGGPCRTDRRQPIRAHRWHGRRLDSRQGDAGHGSSDRQASASRHADRRVPSAAGASRSCLAERKMAAADSHCLLPISLVSSFNAGINQLHRIGTPPPGNLRAVPHPRHATSSSFRSPPPEYPSPSRRRWSVTRYFAVGIEPTQIHSRERIAHRLECRNVNSTACFLSNRNRFRHRMFASIPRRDQPVERSVLHRLANRLVRSDHLLRSREVRRRPLFRFAPTPSEPCIDDKKPVCHRSRAVCSAQFGESVTHAIITPGV